jgi:imidazolonepropionase-like amidohydrolase
MKLMTSRFATKLLGIFLLGTSILCPAADKIYAIHAARLIDGTGAQPVSDAMVVVVNGRIESVGPAATVRVPAGAEKVELGDETLLPGLIDTHGHLSYRVGLNGIPLSQQIVEPDSAQLMRMVRNARLHLLTGITTMRMTGENNFNDIVLRDAIESGLHPGPRIVPSGIPITSSRGHGPPIWWKKGAEDIRKVVRLNAASGAKWQKLLMIDVDPEHAQMTIEEAKTAVDEAHRLGLKVTVHCTGRWGSSIRTAVLAGADNVEHARPLTPEIIRLLAERHVSISATPIVYIFPSPPNFWEVIDTAADGAQLNHTMHDILYKFRSEHPEFETQDRPVKSLDEPERARTDYVPAIRTNEQEFYRAHQAGIPISLGQDSLIGTVPLGIEYLVEGGFTNLEAIQAATSVAAKLIGYGDEFGTLEKGKSADIISVKGNPAQKIEDILNIHFIMRSGIRYDTLSWR